MAQTVYFQEKRTHRSSGKKSKSFLIIFLVLIVLGGLSYLIIFSPVFKIKEIKISGAEQFNEIELISQLKDFAKSQSGFSKFLGPDNILSWINDLGDFNKNYPVFEKIIIKKFLFRRIIEINVKEREKFGIWCLMAQTDTEITQSVCWWFDKTGFIFSEAPFSEGSLVRKMNDYSKRTLKVGDLVLPDNLFQNFLKIYAVLDKIELKTNNLSLENIDWQEMFLEASDSSPKIYFSLKFDPGFFISGLDSLKQDPGFNKLLYIDLRTENRIYYKLK